jgi:hypothetical protein
VAPAGKALSLPAKLKPDFSHNFVDQNAANKPDRPFEVVFRAMELLRPDNRFDEMDLLIDRKTLRKFFDFCKGIVQDSFRLNLYLVNDTLLIQQCMKSPTKCMGHSGGSPLGYSFDKAVTRLPYGLRDSSSYHRVIQYDFGSLKCAVRFQADVAYGYREPMEISEDQLSEVAPRDQQMDSLAAAFSLLTLKDAGTDTLLDYGPS